MGKPQRTKQKRPPNALAASVPTRRQLCTDSVLVFITTELLPQFRIRRPSTGVSHKDREFESDESDIFSRKSLEAKPTPTPSKFAQKREKKTSRTPTAEPHPRAHARPAAPPALSRDFYKKLASGRRAERATIPTDSAYSEENEGTKDIPTRQSSWIAQENNNNGNNNNNEIGSFGISR